MKLGIGVIFLGIIKTITKILNAIFTAVAYILLYFGLWVPCLYMLFWLVLWLGLDFNVAKLSVDTVLFYIGLGLSLACSLTIIIRNFLLKPITKISEYHKREKAIFRRAVVDRALKLQKKNPSKYKNLYGDLSPYDVPDLSKKKLKPNKHIQPIVYRSERNRDIVIHEYPDKFEVYTDTSGTLKYIETKPKNNSTKG